MSVQWRDLGWRDGISMSVYTNYTIVLTWNIQITVAWSWFDILLMFLYSSQPQFWNSTYQPVMFRDIWTARVSINVEQNRNRFILENGKSNNCVCYCSPAGGSTTVHKSICYIPHITRIKHTGTEECYLRLFIGIWLESLWSDHSW